MNDYLIEARGLVKTYGGNGVQVHALREVNVNIRRGEFVAIMGHSGSGKSTLMNILGCLDSPTSGTYLFDGRDVGRLSRNELALVRNQKIGFVFQSFNLLPRLSALDNVLLPMLYNYGEKLSEEECHLRASAALDSVGLGNRLRHRPNQLSGGQQQRVAIARALVNRPMLVLADEPTGNLDTQASREVLEILLGLHAQGVTLVMVTHEPEMAAQAQREIPMRDGQVLDGPLHRSDDPAEYSNSETRDPGRAQTAASSSGVLP